MPAFGLDISDSWIRLAQLSRQRSRLHLPVRAEIAMPTGYVVDGDITHPKEVTTLLMNLVQAANPHTQQAVVALPERHTFIKLISFDQNSGPITVDRIKAEASQHLPYTWEEIYFDWHILPQKNSLGQCQALIGAAPRRLVDTYVSVVTEAGIQPVSLAIESLAIARATFQPEQLHGAHILLDLGQSRTTLILVQDGVVQFSATIRYAGKDLNRYITDELHITNAQAERAKRIFGLDPNQGKGLLRHVLMPAFLVLANKVKDVENFYADHFVDHQPISTIVLTGHGALVRGVGEALGECLTQPVIIQPSSIYQDLLRVHHDLLPDTAFTFSAAFGLALEALEYSS